MQQEKSLIFQSLISRFSENAKNIKEPQSKEQEEITKPKPLKTSAKNQHILIQPIETDKEQTDKDEPVPEPDVLKLAHWNVNGIRAVMKKPGFKDFMQRDFDIICLNETKIDIERLKSSKVLDAAQFAGYHKYFFCASSKKGYSGVAILTKIKPKRYLLGIDEQVGDAEGRCLTLEFERVFVVSVYVPNSQARLARLDFRINTWDKRFGEFVNGLKKQKPVVILGDLNVAHHEIDLFDPRSSRYSPGFSDQERESFSQMLEGGWVDVFRHLNPGRVQYTWWSYFASARTRNLGWRIDYALVQETFLSKIQKMQILDEIWGSDHCPLEVVIDNSA